VLWRVHEIGVDPGTREHRSHDIDGALAEAGSKQTVERLDPFVEPGLCIARLRDAS
jgi:hypothetical protein